LSIARKLFRHKTSVDADSAAPQSSQAYRAKHYEDLGLLLNEDESTRAISRSGVQRALHAAAAILGAVVVAAGASWVVARGHPGSTLLSWARRPAAAKNQPAPSPPISQAASIGLTSSNRWFEVERTPGASRITPTAQAQSTPEFWLIIALARFQSGDAEGAKAAASQALELDPRNGGAAVLLGTLHLDAHEQLEGERELSRYLELEPEGAYADQARRLLKSP
jgi:hypothetical protein